MEREHVLVTCVVNWAHLPAHVWALIVRNVTVLDLYHVAHVCRALHELFTSRRTCLCRDGRTVFCPRADKELEQTRALWTHLRHVRAPPSLCEWVACVRNAHVGRVAFAVRCGADPSAGDQYAICIAAEQGDVHVVDYLLSHACVDPNVSFREPLLMAVTGGHVAVVQRLLRDERVGPRADFPNLLSMACWRGHVPLVEYLLHEKGVDLGAVSPPPLTTACAHGGLAIVEFLLAHPRVDPRAGNHVAFYEACANGHLAVVQRLLQDPRVDPLAYRHPVTNECALTVATYHGHLRVVELLLSDERVVRDPSALHGALRHANCMCHLHIIVLLESCVASR